MRPYNGDSSIHEYLTQFRITAETANWHVDTWGGRLATALEGRARSVFSLDPTISKPTFESMSALLINRFDPEDRPEVWKCTLETRRRGEKETLTDLAYRILDMSGKAFPKLDMALHRELACSYFVNALTDEGQRMHVKCLAPATLDEALKKEVAYESSLKTETRREIPTASGRKIRAVGTDSVQSHQELSANANGRGANTPNSTRANGDCCTNKELAVLNTTVSALAVQIRQLATSMTPSRQGVPESYSRAPMYAPESGPHTEGCDPPRGLCWTCGASDHFKMQCPNYACAPS
jgi:hypothetical protein